MDKEQLILEIEELEERIAPSCVNGESATGGTCDEQDTNPADSRGSDFDPNEASGS